MTLSLEALHGRVMDTDSHEQTPVTRWGETFGDRGAHFATSSAKMFEILKASSARIPGIKETDSMYVDAVDDEAIAPETVWELKGVIGPSAFDLSRRPAVMDVMGFHRELVFPMMGLAAMAVCMGGSVVEASTEEMEVADQAIDAHNEWAAAMTRSFPDRLRPTGVLRSWRTDTTPEGFAAEAAQLIKSGIKALFITPTTPPIGLSPAAPELDRFYATLTEANVSLVSHPHQPGRKAGLIAERWLRVGAVSAGAPKDPENFIGVLVGGGVFERHPTLRYGAIEYGSDWIGPLADRLDHAADPTAHFFPISQKMTLKPSEYIARNVRVSALLDDPVERWIGRHPGLESVYCYSSDYPHVEGRPYSLKGFYDRIAPLGDDVTEKFFCSNASLLLP